MQYFELIRKDVLPSEAISSNTAIFFQDARQQIYGKETNCTLRDHMTDSTPASRFQPIKSTHRTHRGSTVHPPCHACKRTLLPSRYALAELSYLTLQGMKKEYLRIEKSNGAELKAKRLHDSCGQAKS